MFGAKTRFRAYLNQIRPYAMGIDNRGWLPADFDSAAVREARLDPTHVIFNLPEPPMSWFDSLFLTKTQYTAYINLRQTISNFNSSLAAVNNSRRDLQDTYYGLIVLLHAFTIGCLGSGGLFDAFRFAEEAFK
jgi:hypothetical protein